MSLEEDLHQIQDAQEKTEARWLAEAEWLRNEVRDFNILVAEAARILQSRGVQGIPVAESKKSIFWKLPVHRMTPQRVWMAGIGQVPDGPAITDTGLYVASAYLNGMPYPKVRGGRSAGLRHGGTYAVLNGRVEDVNNYQAPGRGSPRHGNYISRTGNGGPVLELGGIEYDVTKSDARAWLTSTVASLLR